MQKESFTLLLPDYIVIDLINRHGPKNRKSIKNLLYSNHMNLSSNPRMSKKSQSSSLWAKQHRAQPVPSWRNQAARNWSRDSTYGVAEPCLLSLPQFWLVDHSPQLRENTNVHTDRHTDLWVKAKWGQVQNVRANWVPPTYYIQLIRRISGREILSP